MVVSAHLSLHLQHSSFCLEIFLLVGGRWVGSRRGSKKAEISFIQLPSPAVSVCLVCVRDVCRQIWVLPLSMLKFLLWPEGHALLRHVSPDHFLQAMEFMCFPI